MERFTEFDLAKDPLAAFLAAAYKANKEYIGTNVRFYMLVFKVQKGYFDSDTVSKNWKYHNTGNLKSVRISAEPLDCSSPESTPSQERPMDR